MIHFNMRQILFYPCRYSLTPGDCVGRSSTIRAYKNPKVCEKILFSIGCYYVCHVKRLKIHDYWNIFSGAFVIRTDNPMGFTKTTLSIIMVMCPFWSRTVNESRNLQSWLKRIVAQKHTSAVPQIISEMDIYLQSIVYILGITCDSAVLCVDDYSL